MCSFAAKTFTRRQTFSFLLLCYNAKKRAICENKFFIMFFVMFLKQTTVKILIYTVEVRLCYPSFEAKISKSHNKNDKPISSCRNKTSDCNLL